LTAIGIAYCLFQTQLWQSIVTDKRRISLLPSGEYQTRYWIVKDILPKEKPRNTKGHPAAIPFRQEVLDDILLLVPRTAGCQWKKMLPKERIWFWLYLSQKVPGMG
jgi:hypothetical protein